MTLNTENVFAVFNQFMLNPDTGRIRKLLVRYELFKMTINVPGDIVECGVFKGAGLAYWLKLLDIFSQGSGKRVLGFDLFESDDSQISEYAENKDQTGFLDEWRKQKNLFDQVSNDLKNIDAAHKYERIISDWSLCNPPLK